MSRPVSTPRPPARRMALLAALMGFSLLSCGREVTGPENGVGARFASGLSFSAVFPEPLASVEDGAGSVVPFERVRVIFRRADGSIALDQMVEFPAGQTEIALSLTVPISNRAPAEGENLSLSLRYINATGDTVFSGGPITVLAAPSTSGSPPATPEVPLTYTGPGNEATTVAIAPDTVWVNAGQPFAFTATAADACAATVTDAPLVWSSLDPAKASAAANGDGEGNALASRGPARVRVALAAGGSGSGWADTAIVMIAPVRGALALFSGGGQVGTAGAALDDSIVVRVNATDGLPLAGISVAFAATTGGGSVSVDTVVSDSLGLATTAWTLGASAGAQTLTASVASLAPLVVTATAEATSPTQLVITTPPAVAATAGVLLAPIVAEVRTAANLISSLYTDSVTLSVASGPAGGAVLGRIKTAAVDGVVTFDSVLVQRAGVYTFTLSASGLTSAVTSSVNVAATVADSLTLVSGGNQIALPGTALPAPVVVRVSDAYGNPVAGANVAAVPQQSGSSVLPTSAATDSLGHASFAWTLANEAGTQELLVDVTSTSIPTLSVQANNAVGPIVGTKVLPALDTLTFINETLALTAASEDVATNPVSGVYTWTTLDSTVASVDSTGLVTAIGNGSALIVVTEAGGTADTAEVVVLQQVSSVTIAPSIKEIYLGTTFPFTAQAVDGGGTPLATQPSVIWSTQNESIATVNVTGLVTSTGLGSTQLRAQVGAIMGVAGVTVKTPITRIAVLRDSVGFVQSDSFTIAALQRTRSYRAVAYDTLDVPMTGITFVFESSNPSVAVTDSTGSATLRVKALANGLTDIRATAQGVTGKAWLRVQQALADLDLTPKVVNIAPTGQQTLTARGLDADGYFLPSVSGVTFQSLNTGIASVNASTGVLLGVSAGTALVTAFKDSIHADTITVTVGTGVPAVISFGRDSLAIGRSGSQSVPVYLSKPSLTPVTVTLAVADTFAYFTQASINIAAGATSGNATLNGRNAGATRIFATDGSGSPVYAGDTAILAVQANVRFTTTSYSLVATNQTSTQILLSDPAPPGGAYVSYAFGTPGRVSISPDPAFIPAGQLAANVVITALAGGGTTVTPVTEGATGQTATINTYPASLDLNGSLFRLGLGQERADIYVQAQSNVTEPRLVTLTSSDTNVVKVPASVVIPNGSYYIYFGMRAGGSAGTAKIYASAPGWLGDSVSVIVSTPRIGICCDAARETTSPAAGISVTSRDSLGTTYARITPLVVSLSTSDTNIVKLNGTTMTILAGASSASGVTYQPAGGTGTAQIYASAPGHGTDTINITVTGPKLSFSYTTARTGLGQYNTSGYVQVPNNTTAPLIVTLSTKNGGIAGIPDTVTIPTGTYYRYFDFAGLATGTDTIYASAPGHQPDTAVIIVSSPRLALSGGGTFDRFRPPVNITAFTRDSVNGGYAVLDTLAVSFTSTNPAVVSVTPTAKVNPGASSIGAQMVFGDTGSTLIIATAPGYVPDTIAATVRTPKLSFSWTTYRLGRRQLSGLSALYVHVPDNRNDTLPVTITRTNPSIDSITSSPDIPTGTYYRYFGVAGLQTGTDTLIASAPGYLPDTAVIIVTSSRLVVGALPATRTTTSPPAGFNVSTADSVGTGHPTMDTVVVSAVSTDPGVMQLTQPSYRILPGGTTISPQVSFVGPGTASITVSDSLNSGYAGASTNAVVVSGPSLTLTNSEPKLGMRQHNGNTGAYVSVQNAVTGSPLTVFLTSSDPSVASVPPSVVIPVGSTFAYFRVTAYDQVATVQITATAVGYATANVNQQVTAPRFLINAPTSLRTTALPGTVTVSAADADGNTHPVTENVVVTLTSTDPSVAFIDSATVTIAADQLSNNTARVRPLTVGSINLEASDERIDPWRYGTATRTFSVTTPTVTFNFTTLTLGVGQYADQSINVPDTRTSPLIVTLTHTGAASSTADTLTVNTAASSRVLRVVGAAVGLDSIRTSAPGYFGDSVAITVGLGRVDGISSWPTTLSTDSVLVTLRARDPLSNERPVLAATAFNLSADANVSFSRLNAPVTSVTIPAGASNVSFYVKRVSGGVANVSITNANYQTYNSAITVNAP